MSTNRQTINTQQPFNTCTNNENKNQNHGYIKIVKNRGLWHQCGLNVVSNTQSSLNI